MVAASGHEAQKSTRRGHAEKVPPGKCDTATATGPAHPVSRSVAHNHICGPQGTEWCPVYPEKIGGPYGSPQGAMWPSARSTLPVPVAEQVTDARDDQTHAGQDGEATQDRSQRVRDHLSAFRSAAICWAKTPNPFAPHEHRQPVSACCAVWTSRRGLALPRSVLLIACPLLPDPLGRLPPIIQTRPPNTTPDAKKRPDR